MKNTEGKYFKGILQEKIYKLKSKSHEPVKQEAGPLDEIEKAKKLLDMGAIEQEQFEKIRDNCLKKLE